jgi:hypothetical protein
MRSTTYLEDAANAMVAAARLGRPVLPILKKHCPHIARQIVQDGAMEKLLSLWGQSCNIDENAGQEIVPPPILQVIGELAGVPMRGRFVHAGLEHTYGYLFSLIETPYGFKRTRWVSTDLEIGFGLDPTLLGDQPNAGTLLGNLSWFLARIVFRAQPDCMPQQAPATVAPDIVNYPYADLAILRIVERIEIGPTPIRIYTDLVPFPHSAPQTDKENQLLIYSLQKRSAASPKLVTAFPVKKSMVDELMTSAQSSGKAPIRLRYNAYVRGMYGLTFNGYRTMETNA